MFFNHEVLKRKGPLGIVWLSSVLSQSLRTKKIKRNDYLAVNLEKSCTHILSHFGTGGGFKLSLYLAGQLLFGCIRVFERKAYYLLEDLQQFERLINKRNVATNLSSIDLPEHMRDVNLTLKDIQSPQHNPFSFTERVIMNETGDHLDDLMDFTQDFLGTVSARSSTVTRSDPTIADPAKITMRDPSPIREQDPMMAFGPDGGRFGDEFDAASKQIMDQLMTEREIGESDAVPTLNAGLSFDVPSMQAMRPSDETLAPQVITDHDLLEPIRGEGMFVAPAPPPMDTTRPQSPSSTMVRSDVVIGSGSSYFTLPEIVNSRAAGTGRKRKGKARAPRRLIIDEVKSVSRASVAKLMDDRSELIVKKSSIVQLPKLAAVSGVNLFIEPATAASVGMMGSGLKEYMAKAFQLQSKFSLAHAQMEEDARRGRKRTRRSDVVVVDPLVSVQSGNVTEPLFLDGSARDVSRGLNDEANNLSTSGRGNINLGDVRSANVSGDVRLSAVDPASFIMRNDNIFDISDLNQYQNDVNNTTLAPIQEIVTDQQQQGIDADHKAGLVSPPPLVRAVPVDSDIVSPSAARRRKYRCTSPVKYPDMPTRSASRAGLTQAEMIATLKDNLPFDENANEYVVSTFRQMYPSEHFNRTQAAKHFAALLTLAGKGYVKLSQPQYAGDVVIERGRKLCN